MITIFKSITASTITHDYNYAITITYDYDFKKCITASVCLTKSATLLLRRLGDYTQLHKTITLFKKYYCVDDYMKIHTITFFYYNYFITIIILY